MSKPSKKQFDINANWTSTHVVEGWRHFRICGRRNTENGLELELMAVCDRAVRFWLPKPALEDAEVWKTGWSDL